MSAAALLDKSPFGGARSADRPFRQIAFARSLVGQRACGNAHSLFKRNSAFQPFVNGGGSHSEMTASGGNALERLITNRHGAKVAPVLRALLKACGPAAVFGRIVSIRINAINAVVRARSLAHVRQEVDERRIPAPANPDSATAVLRKILAVFVRTSPFYADPDAIRRTALAADLMAVPEGVQIAFSSHVACIDESEQLGKATA